MIVGLGFGEGLLFNIKYNNGKENKEGWNLRKVRYSLRSFPQKGRQEIRNHPKSQILQSIQRQGKFDLQLWASKRLSLKQLLTRHILNYRIASKELPLESGNARALEEKLQEVHTLSQLQPL